MLRYRKRDRKKPFSRKINQAVESSELFLLFTWFICISATH